MQMNVLKNMISLKSIKTLSTNIYKIWCYAFTEMMNNAIEHSQADTVQIGIWQDYLTTTILLNDDGIGIFKKIKEYYHYETLEDSINMLFNPIKNYFPMINILIFLVILTFLNLKLMTKALLYVWNYPILAKEQQRRSLICFLIKMKVLLKQESH